MFFMKKCLNKNLLFGITLLVITPQAFSNSKLLSEHESGFYLGIQGGRAWTQEGNGPEQEIAEKSTIYPRSSKDVNKDKFGCRTYIGYSFTPYFSLESGYTYYPKNKYDFKAITIDPTFHELIDHSHYSFKTNFFAIDLMIKGILPLEKLHTALAGWSIYGQAGPVIAIANYESQMVGSIYFHSEDNMFNTRYVRAPSVDIKPAYSLGLTYNFTDNFAADLSWFYIYSNDKVEKEDVIKHIGYIKTKDDLNINKIPKASAIMLGISYKF